jgi:hypothetical protein
MEIGPMRSLICSSVLGLSIACACAVTRAAETGDKDAAEWAKAEQAFVTFVTPVVKEARERLKDPRIQWARVNNDLLRKYLPDVRVYIRDGASSGEDMLWIVTRDGTITALGDGTWRGVDGDKWRAVEKISAYVEGRAHQGRVGGAGGGGGEAHRVHRRRAQQCRHAPAEHEGLHRVR